MVLSHGSFSLGYPHGESIISFTFFASWRFIFWFLTARFAQNAGDAKIFSPAVENNAIFLQLAKS